eukprot:gene7083-185_t
MARGRTGKAASIENRDAQIKELERVYDTLDPDSGTSDFIEWVGSDEDHPILVHPSVLEQWYHQWPQRTNLQKNMPKIDEFFQTYITDEFTRRSQYLSLFLGFRTALASAFIHFVKGGVKALARLTRRKKIIKFVHFTCDTLLPTTYWGPCLGVNMGLSELAAGSKWGMVSSNFRSSKQLAKASLQTCIWPGSCPKTVAAVRKLEFQASKPTVVKNKGGRSNKKNPSVNAVVKQYAGGDFAAGYED